MKQKCSRCGNTLELNTNNFKKKFDCINGYVKQCKKCMHKKDKEYRQKHKINATNYRKEHKEYLKLYFRDYRKKNPSISSKTTQTWREKNRKHFKKQQSIYWKSHRERERLRDKYKRLVNSDYKITKLLRHRINQAIKHNYKSAHTMDLIGCDISFLKNWLNITALNNGYKNFNINNYNSKNYHIDHKIPVNAFNLNCSYHQKLCFHWSNMQILKAEENMKKHVCLSL